MLFMTVADLIIFITVKHCALCIRGPGRLHLLYVPKEHLRVPVTTIFKSSEDRKIFQIRLLAVAAISVGIERLRPEIIGHHSVTGNQISFFLVP